MRGRFIGKTSMGFVTGEVYELRSDIKTIAKNGHYIQPCICLYDKFSGAWCPYSSLENVLKNWDFGSSEAAAKVKTKMPYLFERFQGKCFTPYRSLEAILENWEFMPNLHKQEN